MTSIVIPNAVTNVGSSAFMFCLDLANVTIGSGVTSIGSYAFFACVNLTNASIPSSVTSIGDYVFADCGLLPAISVDPANPAYSSVNGVLFDKNQATIIQYPGGKTGSSYAIPNGVTNIEDGAFFICTNLIRVTIPNGVTNIGGAAFYYCLGLTSLVIPNSVTNIGIQAFEYCSNLTALYFQGYPPSLGSSAFEDDSKLIIYYLPDINGWSSPYGDVTAEMWNPQATTLSVAGGNFGFKITGPANAVVVVIACANLANPVWLPVSTNTLAGGASSFSDLQSTNYPGRYYRFRSP